MAVGTKRRWIYVSTAIAAAVILILAVILLQQPIQNKTTPPPTRSAPGVSTIAASGVGQSAATLNGDLWNLGTAAHSIVGFLYGTDGGLAGASNVTVANETATTAFYHAVSGLSLSTTYYFKAWALGDGFGFGSVLSFTTQGPATPQKQAPSVETKAASSVTAMFATLNGNLGDLGTASSVTVGFLYGTSPSLAFALNLSVGTRTATGAFTQSLTGLASNTTYYVQAWAAGDGFASGSILSFTTSSASGNGNQVPPGWAHAACPTIPDDAPAHGVRSRCLYNETYGERKKEGQSSGTAAALPLWAPQFIALAYAPGSSDGHWSANIRAL